MENISLKEFASSIHFFNGPLPAKVCLDDVAQAVEEDSGISFIVVITMSKLSILLAKSFLVRAKAFTGKDQ